MVNAEFSSDALSRISRSLTYWQNKEFSFVSLPWVAPRLYTEATRPAWGACQPDVGAYGALLASGEQAFLQMEAEDRLSEEERFVGWTPCFRDEAVFDATHHLYFMKTELFIKVDPHQAEQEVQRLVTGSMEFFAAELRAAGLGHFAHDHLQKIACDELQWDIELNGVELGSYGYREHFGVTYAYGTACAEPRFSQALAQLRGLDLR